MKKYLIFAISITICLSTLFKPQIAQANSAQTDWYGSSQTGAIITGEECPLTVQKEILTFNIHNFPMLHGNTHNTQNYNATVSANYYFYNPTDLDIDVELAFPFGQIPSYMSSIDSTKCNVEINDKEIQSEIHYSYSSNSKNYSNNLNFGDSDIEKIKTLRNSKILIDEQSIAYVYSFYIKEGTYQIFTSGIENNIIVTSSAPITREKCETGIDLKMKLRYNYDKYPLKIYVIGEKPEEIYLNKQLNESSYISIYPKQEETQEIVFSESIYQQFEALSISNNFNTKEEYFKSVVDVITIDCNSFGQSDYYVNSGNFSKRLIGWITYNMTVGANQTINNKVTAPLYPDLDTAWNPPKYTYTYLLSPAKCWAGFEELEIIINTSAKILKSDGFEFEKIDDGYKATINGLPNRELEFTLCKTDEPKFIYSKHYGCMLNAEKELSTLFISLSAFLLIKFIYKHKKQSN